GLLRAAPEDIRVAALQAHDLAAGLRLAHEQLVDLRLLECVAVRPLPREDAPRVRGEVEQLRVDEVVVDDDVRLLQQEEPSMRDQVEVAGPGADEVDDAL